MEPGGVKLATVSGLVPASTGTAAYPKKIWGKDKNGSKITRNVSAILRKQNTVLRGKAYEYKLGIRGMVFTSIELLQNKGDTLLYSIEIPLNFAG
jgi:hypothetical protein